MKQEAAVRKNAESFLDEVVNCLNVEFNREKKKNLRAKIQMN